VDIFNEKLLIVDSDENLQQILKTRFTKLGFNVFSAFNGEFALAIFDEEQPDLVILDVMLPKLDGYEVCRVIRKKSQTPILILTSLSDTTDCVMGLELGADDYIIKPFSPNELEARLYAALRRSRNHIQAIPKKSKFLTIGNLVIDTNKKQVVKNSRTIKLTSIEFSLLELLIENAGKKLSRLTILDNIWGYTPERYVDNRIVDVHISRLRSKLEENSSSPDLILTVRGTGYMFQDYS